jgi:threonine/homoserine/homoserine lactone efflux protein
MIGIAMPDLTLFVQGLALGMTAAASPGPFQTYLVNQTLNKGGQKTVPLAFAPLISDIPIVLIILLALDHLPAQFLRFVSLAGGIFVLYLSWSLLRQWIKPAQSNRSDTDRSQSVSYEETRARVAQSSLMRGVLMNSMSPGPYTFWMLVSGPILLAALRQSWLMGATFLFGFYGALIGGFLGIVLLFHLAHRMGPRVVRIFSLLSIFVLIIFGVILFARGIQG